MILGVKMKHLGMSLQTLCRGFALFELLLYCFKKGNMDISTSMTVGCSGDRMLAEHKQLWFVHVCSGDRMPLKHKRNYGRAWILQ